MLSGRIRDQRASFKYSIKNTGDTKSMPNTNVQHDFSASRFASTEQLLLQLNPMAQTEPAGVFLLLKMSLQNQDVK